MLTRRQQILLKRAQKEAGIPDPEYRAALATVSALPLCYSSKDSRLTDRHLDNLLSYFEEIHWKAVAEGLLQPSGKPDAIFRQPRYWADRNQKNNTSRDRYIAKDFTQLIQAAEAELNDLGYGFPYLASIQRRIRPFTQASYLAALNRTLKSKTNKPAPSASELEPEIPF